MVTITYLVSLFISMTRILGKLVLIIALLGQFILTPAMAMPSALVATMHSGQMSGHMQMTQTEMPSQNELGRVMSHQGEPCQMSGVSELVDCEALCAAIGPGDCVSHCASILGALDASVPSLAVPDHSGPIVTSAWSLQTAELTPLSPPPIG
ncbi:MULTISPECIES: hypothetical protein [Shewanella]|uniref:CopL family metal-binding regulatory protein n=1 Tax=Shewanella marisflavi TaxID=260364 RepID=A0ABX5WQG4_9GAMM|nr:MULTISPECIES: hypothetical protein [Shewanella]QDF76811.1 hypothetical protein FGA12_17505 [Shewanella marisflavi]